MLLRLIPFSPPLVLSKDYPSTLVVDLYTDNRPECGVFSGRHCGFELPEEMEQRMPTLQEAFYDDASYQRFVIDRPRSCVPVGQMRSYHYAVIGWDSGVYLAHPEVHTLVLFETWSEQGVDWHVAVVGQRMHFSISLDHYQPGAVARGDVILRAQP